MSSRGFALAITTYTLIPIRIPQPAEMTPAEAARALYWLPLIGAGLAAAAGLPAAGLLALSDRNALLAALAAVATLALLTRGLHLDGLADVADGLGSRAEPEHAQRIMHQSDIGPFGVVTLVCTLLGELLALNRLADDAGWRPLCALVTAAVTGRLCVLLAARPGVQASPASRFGALVAGSARRSVVFAVTAAGLVGGAALGWFTAGRWWYWPTSQLAVLAAGLLLERHCVRRLGGISGDLFGALVEFGTVSVLLLLAVGGAA
jgi:adenosylcobinamide-GDP ribazoletransferase